MNYVVGEHMPSAESKQGEVEAGRSRRQKNEHFKFGIPAAVATNEALNHDTRWVAALKYTARFDWMTLCQWQQLASLQ